MTIRDTAGSLTVEMEEPCRGDQVKVWQDEAYPLVITKDEWRELRSKVDRVFLAAEAINGER